jgi:hypothetical protein
MTMHTICESLDLLFEVGVVGVQNGGIVLGSPELVLQEPQCFLWCVRREMTKCE